MRNGNQCQNKDILESFEGSFRPEAEVDDEDETEELNGRRSKENGEV
jgi:hypothetical protein